jgi:hypothetical protein
MACHHYRSFLGLREGMAPLPQPAQNYTKGVFGWLYMYNQAHRMQADVVRLPRNSQEASFQSFEKTYNIEQ